MADLNLIFSREEIARRTRELGEAITRDYAGCRLVVIGILKGAFIFTADLVRAIDLPLEIDFIRVASYGSKSCSSGDLKLTKDVELPLAGKDVLLVEDIVDTGRTVACLKELFERHQPRSVRICALIDKKERREMDAEIDYIGFTVAKGFLVGFGLDYAERHRQYPAVYHLENPKN
ncbi:MAG: hypoxanthine phosphoribosyltransferase [Deltaproteobacteria bacterium]|jgi:hypoxanthine phosphoribosyltransferase